MFPIFDLRFNSSSGKLELTSQLVKKGEFLQGSRLIETLPSEAGARAVQGVKLGGIIILFVWLVPSREAPQVFLTYRGISKDSHDPQSASVCARRMGWGGIGRSQHDVVHTVPPILPRHPVCLCLIHPSVGNMCLENAQWSGRQSWETSLCCCHRHRTLVSGKQAGNEWHTMHFRPLGVDLKSCVSEMQWCIMQRERKGMYVHSIRSIFFIVLTWK